jgi:hypothetical protein
MSVSLEVRTESWLPTEYSTKFNLLLYALLPCKIPRMASADTCRGSILVVVQWIQHQEQDSTQLTTAQSWVLDL